MPEDKGQRPAEQRPEPVGPLLEAVVAELGLTERLESCRARLAWEEVAGPALAGQAQALRLERGRLELAVPSAVWRTQLSFSKLQLIERLNQCLGKVLVRDLVFVNRRSDAGGRNIQRGR
ncbi:MAG: DUF721 domain-containing protein [Gemmatimonadota bacterium]